MEKETGKNNSFTLAYTFAGILLTIFIWFTIAFLHGEYVQNNISFVLFLIIGIPLFIVSLGVIPLLRRLANIRAKRHKKWLEDISGNPDKIRSLKLKKVLWWFVVIILFVIVPILRLMGKF